VVFEAGAYIWWAAALDSGAFERRRVDSLLALAITRARRLGPAADFWLATAHGYRAREPCPARRGGRKDSKSDERLPARARRPGLRQLS
jgi:hypothetical protein